MAAARLNRFVNQLAPNQCAVAAGDGKLFDNVPVAPPDAIFRTKAMYLADQHPDKVDLGIGAYRDDNGKPVVLNVVRKVEQELANNKDLNHEYLGITGDPEFASLSCKLLLGANSPRIASIQTLSGTGSLRVAAEFLDRFLPGRAVYLSVPTWGNHQSILKDSFLTGRKYRYWDSKKLGLDLRGMIDDLRNAPDGSIIMLHACAHNPTGLDPTKDEWKEIAEVMRAKSHFPWFDCAYQGFATGSLDDDAWAVRYFYEQGFNFLVCQSFAKNMGLYGERIGALHVVTPNADRATAVKSQLSVIVRPMYSNPPAHGARVVKRILSDPALFAEWQAEMQVMSKRILAMRQGLHGELKKLQTPGNWDHIVTQTGMFSFTGLSPQQCDTLIKKWHVYLLTNGRISLAGLNSKNLSYMAKAMHDVVINVK